MKVSARLKLVVEDRNEKHSLLEEAMEEVIEDLASITEALESVQAERELNEDILCGILDRIGQIERKINHKEEEGPTMATKTSSHAVNTSELYKVHMNKEENIEGRGVKECNAITTNDASDMLEKISDFHREEIANVKQMLVLRDAITDNRLNKLEEENQKMKECLNANKLYLPEAEDTTQVTKTEHNTIIDGCKCSIQ